jgi:CRISPR/Cas system-associated exonuclease Cas4 (RecB family)
MMRMDDLERYRTEVLLRHRRSMSEYLKDGRERGHHVTDFVYGCPRYAWYVYKLREEVGDEDRPLSERDMTVFTVGKKLDELVVGDWHHVKVRKDFDGIEVVGEIDDLIIDSDVLIVIDKKHLRGKPPKEAHSHYVTQVNSYIYFLVDGCVIDGVGYGDLEALREKLSGCFTQFYGAVLYIDVSLETSQVSDVVIWEVRPEDLTQMAKFWRSMIREMALIPPVPRISWFCSYCPFVRKCAEVGL